MLFFENHLNGVTTACHKGRPCREICTVLLTEIQSSNQRTVSVEVGALEVVEQFTTTGHHAKKTTTGVVILVVFLEVVRKMIDTSGQKSDPVSPAARWNLATISDLFISTDI